MYVVATILGFATYLLINPLAMWIAVFAVMPVVAALLIYWYLIQIHCLPARSANEMMILVSAWIVLSFLLDALTYIFLVPAFADQPRNWTFYADQSPWIWLSYAVLILSGIAGRLLFLRRVRKS